MNIGIDDPPTLRWTGSQLEIIDQTLLPAELRVIELGSVAQVIDAISRLAIRGAPAIGACAAYGLVVAFDEAAPKNTAEAHRALASGADRIGKARPTAVNLSHALNRVKRKAEKGTTVAQTRALALTEADAVFDEDRAACDLIGQHGARELADHRTLMTHCNAGRLATTGIGTALGVVYGKVRDGQSVEVFASETRPLLQGARLTAWELAEAGIPVTVIPDSSACGLLASGEVDAVVVGADRIAANGDVANKVGTLSHALGARQAGVPFYVAAPTSTLDPATPTGVEIPIEQRHPNEVHGVERRVTPTLGVAVWNPAFDVTPADLVTAIITEVGVLKPDYTVSIADALNRVERDGAR